MYSNQDFTQQIQSETQTSHNHIQNNEAILENELSNLSSHSSHNLIPKASLKTDHSQDFDKKQQIKSNIPFFYDGMQIIDKEFAQKYMATFNRNNNSNSRLWSDSKYIAGLTRKPKPTNEIKPQQIFQSRQKSGNSYTHSQSPYKPQSPIVNEQQFEETKVETLETRKQESERKSLSTQEEIKDLTQNFLNIQLRKKLLNDETQTSKFTNLAMEDLSKHIQKIKENLLIGQLDILESSEILKWALDQYHLLDDHQNFQVKDLSIQILLNKKCKALQEIAIALLQKSFIRLNEEVFAQQSFLFDIFHSFRDLIQNIQIEIQQQRNSFRRIQDILQKKSLFQTSQRVSIFTYLLLHLLQQTITSYEFDNALDNIVQICNGFIQQLLHTIVNQDKDSNESKILMSIMVQDLIVNCINDAIEFPVAIILLKSLTLQIIQVIQIENFKISKVDSQTILPSEIDLHHKLFFIEVLQQIMVGVQEILINASQLNQSCYCTVKLKNEQQETNIVECESCSTLFHLQCINRKIVNVKKFMCLECKVSKEFLNKEQIYQMYEEIKQFYHQYQSSYYNFEKSLSFVIISQHAYNQKCMNNNKKNQIQLKEEFKEIQQETVEGRTWMARDHQINIQYIRKLQRLLNIEIELRDIFQSLKNMMLCISFQKQATLRSKAIKAIKQIIMMNPENLHDSQILKIIQLRLMDISASTRESTLDLLWSIISKFAFQDDDYSSQMFESQFIRKYLSIIIERADDNSIGVRKKVVQILSFLLKKNSTIEGNQSEIIKILIKKWQDSNEQIKENLINSLRKTFQSQILKKDGPKLVYQTLKTIINGANEKDSNIFEKVFQLVMTSEDAKDKDNFISKYGLQIAEVCVEDLLSSDIKSEQYNDTLSLCKILSNINPKIMIKRIKVLINLLVIDCLINIFIQDSVENTKHKGELCQILKTIFSYILSKRGQTEVYTTPKMIKELINICEQIITKSPLIIIQQSLELYLVLSQLQYDYSGIIQLFMKCLVFLQSQEAVLNKKKKIEPNMIFSVSRSILVASFIIYLKKLNHLDNEIKIDIQNELLSTLQNMIQSSYLNHQILDIALEGISYIWLQSPDLLNTVCQDIFKVIFEKFNSKNLQNSTKSRVIQTFTKFLDLYDIKMKNEQNYDLSNTLTVIQKELQHFIELLQNEDPVVRLSVSKLIAKMTEYGLIQILDSSKLFIKMLNDCNYESYYNSKSQLIQIIQKKYQIVSSCLSPQEILNNSFNYQVQIFSQFKPVLVSAFVKTIDQQGCIIQWNDTGIYDDILESLYKQNDQSIIFLIKQIVTFIEDTSNYKNFQNDTKYLTLFGQILFSFIKVGKCQDQYLKIIENYLSTHEIMIYETIKKAIKSSGGIHPQIYSQGFLLLIFKLSQKLCQKVFSILHSNEKQNNEEVFNDNQFIQSKEVTISKQNKISKYISENCDKISEFAIDNLSTLRKNQIIEALETLKEELKLLVKEKENLFRIKIEKKLYGGKKSNIQMGTDHKKGKKSMGLIVNNNKKRKRDEFEGNDVEMSDDNQGDGDWKDDIRKNNYDNQRKSEQQNVKRRKFNAKSRK